MEEKEFNMTHDQIIKAIKFRLERHKLYDPEFTFSVETEGIDSQGKLDSLINMVIGQLYKFDDAKSEGNEEPGDNESDKAGNGEPDGAQAATPTETGGSLQGDYDALKEAYTALKTEHETLKTNVNNDRIKSAHSKVSEFVKETMEGMRFTPEQIQYFTDSNDLTGHVDDGGEIDNKAFDGIRSKVNDFAIVSKPGGNATYSDPALGNGHRNAPPVKSNSDYGAELYRRLGRK